MKLRKKLIEVALPLDAINKASAREKSIRHGHPSTLHLWWARRPLAAARAVLFAQLVDDPSSRPELFPTEEEQEKERQRLFRIIEQLVLWENTTNKEVIRKAQDEIWTSWRRTCEDNKDHPRAQELFNPEKLPAFHDPFAGGGSIPLEAQRLGLEAYASDLNPVAVLINKAMIEIPPKFAGMAPMNPDYQGKLSEEKAANTWEGAQGLAEDVRYYGKWMRSQAEKRIGHLYPKVLVTGEMASERPDLKPYLGRELTVIAWIWARTVKSPNPAFADVDVPLASTFMLSTKKGKEAYVEPVIEKGGYRFTVKTGTPKDAEAAKNGTKLARGANFKCLMSDTPMQSDHIKAEGRAGRMRARLMAIVAEGDHKRVYLSPIDEMEKIANAAIPAWKPETELAPDPRALWTPAYGLTTFGDLFTPRQLVALTTFSDLVQEARELVKSDALAAGMADDGVPLWEGGKTATAYADAVAVYLGISIDKATDYWSTINTWHQSKELIRNVFSRQAIPMTWDYAETNGFSDSAGNVSSGIEWAQKVLVSFASTIPGFAIQGDAQAQSICTDKIVSTDPPYYDNIGYADLSDFFYVWLRRSLKTILPDIFATLAVPKVQELVATPYRHGGKENAEAYFLDGMTKAMRRLSEQSHPYFPVTIYYAFKQSESESDAGIASTGWETFLDALLQAGFAITGTWPMRTELGNRMIGAGTNALASSIVIVCRKADDSATLTTRKEFISTLKMELPRAVGNMQKGNIAPVDLAQASIGPGMAVFTRYSKVLESDGSPMTVRTALGLINQVLDEALAEQEGEFDGDTRWALAWFEQNGMNEGPYGVAETLSTAKNTSVNGLVEAGILSSKGGKVRLLKRDELKEDWDPSADRRLTIWESAQYLIRALEKEGEAGAAELLRKLGGIGETARDLAYRLYSICDRKKWSQEALSYNSLVMSWPAISELSRKVPSEQENDEIGTFNY
ncbi:MAG TPA: DUF1156 domain-containing protein [Spirochaetota bacterium]|nr:DUF1156 domain-containing protein [Spirochaetota bacterium]